MSTSAQPAAGSVIAILMPQAGNSMEEGTILQWRVKPGDRIAVGQTLYEVETDKASVEVEATEAGRIARIVAPEGAVVPVKQPVAYLAESDAELEAFLAEGKPVAGGLKPEARSPKPEVTAAPAPSETAPPKTAARTESGRVKASPAARKLAAEKGLDLARVAAGSGPGGRILTTDLAGLQPSAHLQSATAMPVAYFRQTINAAPLLAFHQAQPAATKRSLDDLILLAVSQTIAQLPDLHTRLQNAGHASLAVCNLAHLGVEEFAAAVPPDQAGILAVGAAREGVIVRDGAMYARRILTLTLSVDHRVVDGALAATFMARLKQMLESPATHLA